MQENENEDDEENEDEDLEEDEEEEDSDADEVVECEDEDEFEEIMRVLGLQPVTLTDTGDLRLPNGSVATHRDVSYIYRQRGTRTDQVALAGNGNPRWQKRAQLMLGNAATSGCLKIAMTRRQEAREGKRIIAVLRERQHYEMRLGIAHNTVNQRMKTRIRTGRGDCSNGR